MPAPKTRSRKQSEAMDLQINVMNLRGCTGTEIGKELGISRYTVCKRLKNINARVMLAREGVKERELRIMEYAQTEAIKAWEVSKAPGEVVYVEQHGGVDKTSTRATKRTSSSSGESAHLMTLLKASESRRKLLGLDAAAKLQLEPTPQVDWSQVDEQTQVDFLECRVTLADVLRKMIVAAVEEEPEVES